MILSVDPAIGKWGYSVIDDDGNIVEKRGIDWTKFKYSKEKRWVMILDILKEVVKRHNITLILTERQFQGSLLQTMCICGIVAGESGAEIRYIAPASWKKWGVGNYRADKTEVKKFVVNLYPELVKEPQDVCDSVAFYLAYKNNKDI